MQRITGTQVVGSGNIGCWNTTNYYNIINVGGTGGEDNQIKQWLSTLEPRHRHQNVQVNRVDGVGGWLLEKSEFREWSGSEGVPKKAVLFCHGDPGVGKTHISSLVIDWLCDRARDTNISVAGLYCDYLTQEEQSTTNMLGAILNQLFERDGIPEAVRQTFRKEKRGFGGRAAQLPDLVKMLKTTIASLPEVFICIDGLDECLPKNRRELLESLQDVVRASPTTRVFLTGRPHVRNEVRRYFAEAVMISIIPTIEDIKRYLKMRLDADPTPDAMGEDLRAEILRVIPRKISQIFLLVSLNIDAVLEEVTIHKRKQKLDEMSQGSGLRDAYSETLARIKAQKGSKSTLSMQALMWLSHSERPLNANELCHALGVEIGSTDLNFQNIPAIETLLGCSLGLVKVEASSYTVRLVHYTLQEYLSDNTDLFPSPHSMIAEVCLTYLNFQCIRDISPSPTGSALPIPLLKYASCYWGTHARREMTESVKALAVRLLDGFDKHVSSGILLSHNQHFDHELGRGDAMGFTGLHGTAYLGIVERAFGLSEVKGWDLSATSAAGNTVISSAAEAGHGDIVEVLLAQEGITPDDADKHGRTPLLWAAENGKGDIVKALLEREDVTPDIMDKDGRTPLSWAASHRHKRIVEMLLGREDVTPDTADNGGRTPLSWAAGNGNEGIVKVLLGRKDVTPDIADKDGRTPLSWAAAHGHVDTVRMLLERGDVTPDTADKIDQTPLSWAIGAWRAGPREAKNRSEDVLGMLLGRQDVTPNIRDNGGRTLLSWAAENGDRGIVQTLLEREDLSPDISDKDGRTPLWWAAGNGHGDIVKMLLEREDVTPDTADKDGRTPLWWAAGNGRGYIVQMLLARKDVTPNTADNYGRTPFSLAAECGHLRVAEMLREWFSVSQELLPERCNVSLDTGMTYADFTRQTALARTSEKRRREELRRPFGNQASVPQSEGGDNSTNPLPAYHSGSSRRPSKRIRRY